MDRVIALEVHNVAAFENAFRCPTLHIEIAPLLAAHFAPLVRGEQVVAVSPDAGGAKRAEQFRQALEHADDTGCRQRLHGEVPQQRYRERRAVDRRCEGKTAVIVDDLISTGGTLIRAAQACRSAGAVRVFAAAAHGLFAGGATELFAAREIDAIAATNTVPAFRVTAEAAMQRLTVLDASQMIARAVAACHDPSCRTRQPESYEPIVITYRE